ncbi:MAG: hypothetical protein RL095_2500 [Verrucomicrobiota bacterium]|jgi:hypothetical protein
MSPRTFVLAALLAALLAGLGFSLAPRPAGGDLAGRCRAAAKEAQAALKERQQHERDAAALQRHLDHLWPAESSPSSLQSRLRALAQQSACQLGFNANSEIKGGKERSVDLLNCSSRGEGQLEALLRFLANVEAHRPSLALTSCRLSPIPSKPGVWSLDAQIQATKRRGP